MVIKYTGHLWMVGLLILLACNEKDEPIDRASETQKQLVGRWEWIQTEYVRRGFGTTIETPVSTNKSQFLQFKSDYTIEHWVNDTLKGNYAYTIRPTTGVELWLDVEGRLSFLPSGTAPFTINRQELLIQAGYNDLGGNSTFMKR